MIPAPISAVTTACCSVFFNRFIQDAATARRITRPNPSVSPAREPNHLGILHFIEINYGLGSLHTADDLANCFDFASSRGLRTAGDKP